MTYEPESDELIIDGVLHGWTGADCPECQGTGYNKEGRNCPDCAGTGEEFDALPVQPVDLLVKEPEERAPTPCNSGGNNSPPVMPDKWGGSKPHQKSWKHRYGVDR